jgi:hypothetical protein
MFALLKIWALPGIRAATAPQKQVPPRRLPGQAGLQHDSGKEHTDMSEPRMVIPSMEAIRLWQGVSVPNAAARHGLAEMEALIAALEALRGTMAFEDEPSGFDAALRACMEPQP